MTKLTRTLILIFIPLVFLSCKKDETKELKNRITILEKNLSELKDSISKSKKDKISHSNIIVQTSKENFKVNEKTKVKFVFNYLENIPEYDVYQILNDDSRKLIIENLSVNEFEYEYSPTKEGWNPIKLMTVFKFGNEKIEVPVFSSIKGEK
ncbi:hypothetical protein [Seonamhaeicola maritimus]|uniref:Lipoprotein n=1 Tax=Seonamhaeicola maritimus TaxID=2591822 RepID=A0A5C7GHF5_9FLAO|nr:hypothetical protein [Seonamhaeicola maritimus]TXG36695.1 hypothetical protein FUA22_08930 [Seonamhaeicola maritimus]